MRLYYGSYGHQPAETHVRISRDPVTDAAGRYYAVRHRWSVEGFLQADTPAALTAAILALQNAYSRNFQPLTLYLPGGNKSAHALPATTPLGGTRVVRAPSFQHSEGGEYVNYRTYSIELECVEPVPGLGNIVLEWAETVSYSGGGPRFVYQQPLKGPPQKQLVAEMTPFKATQSGQARGLYDYPNPPLPIWPGAEHIDQRQVSRKDPKRDGDAHHDFTITWSYSFEQATPLVGLPNRWRG